MPDDSGDIERANVLSIGSVVGGVGAAARAWNEPIRELTLRVGEARVDVESPLNLNVVFHIPGEVFDFDDDCVRTGRYDSRTRHLMVQATLPRILPANPGGFLLARLSEAVGEAEEWVRRRGVAESLPSLRALVQRLE